MVVMLFKLKNKSSGFTLLEILLVIGIIAILAGIVIVAINPSKQLATVRNTERKSDLKQLYNAITQYYIDNSAYPSTISTTTLNEVCNTGSVSATTTALNGASCGTLANLSVLVPTYLTAIPTDPTGTSSLLSFIPTAYAATTATATGTGYKVGVNTAKQVLISAPLAELGVRVVVGNVPTGCVATGGTISTTTGYKIHTFTTVGTSTFTVTGSCNAEVLVVAGGGGGGPGTSGRQGGGGGAGGLIYNSSYSISGTTTDVVVGGGGSSFVNGQNSSFASLIAVGGGHGQRGDASAATSGGSGGGCLGYWSGFETPGAGIAGQGFRGGYNSTASLYGGGGGGGAGEVGYNGTASVNGAGGNGLQYDINGTNVYYAGGGGSGGGPIPTAGAGGNGGGGAGGNDGAAGNNGSPRTGGGGGGGGRNYIGGTGGSGIVIVRYAN
jgi:prepilin-type N-terminal cleavage/methylation domain-containing protein